MAETAKHQKSQHSSPSQFRDASDVKHKGPLAERLLSKRPFA